MIEIRDDKTRLEFGQQGGIYIGNTTAVSGNFIAIQILEDTVLNSATVCNISGLAASGATLGKQIIVGNFTNIKLTSGKVIAYSR